MSQNDLGEFVLGRDPAHFGQAVREPPESSSPNLGEHLSNLQVLQGQQHVGCAPAVFMGARPPHHSSSA